MTVSWARGALCLPWPPAPGGQEVAQAGRGDSGLASSGRSPPEEAVWGYLSAHPSPAYQGGHRAGTCSLSGLDGTSGDRPLTCIGRRPGEVSWAAEGTRPHPALPG